MILKLIRSLKRSKILIVFIAVLLVLLALSRSFRQTVHEFINAIEQNNTSSVVETIASDHERTLDLSTELKQKAHTISVKNTEIPRKVIDVLVFIREYDKAPEGYVGGDHFFNREGILPDRSKTGKKHKYRKWDVNPRIRGQNRGAERLVTSDDAAYYTADHYSSFTEIIE